MGIIYEFSVEYVGITVGDMKNIHNCLMKKYEIV